MSIDANLRFIGNSSTSSAPILGIGYRGSPSISVSMSGIGVPILDKSELEVCKSVLDVNSGSTFILWTSLPVAARRLAKVV